MAAQQTAPTQTTMPQGVELPLPPPEPTPDGWAVGFVRDGRTFRIVRIPFFKGVTKHTLVSDLHSDSGIVLMRAMIKEIQSMLSNAAFRTSMKAGTPK